MLGMFHLLLYSVSNAAISVSRDPGILNKTRFFHCDNMLTRDNNKDILLKSSNCISYSVLAAVSVISSTSIDIIGKTESL